MDILEQLVTEGYDNIIKKNYEEAIKKFTSLFLIGDSMYYLKHLGYAHLVAKNLDRAINCYESYLKRYPEDLDAKIELGESYCHKKEFKPAKKQLDEALKKDPNNKKAAVGLGNVYYEMNELEKAKECYKFVIGTRKDTKWYTEEKENKTEDNKKGIEIAQISIAYSKLIQIYCDQKNWEEINKTDKEAKQFQKETGML